MAKIVLSTSKYLEERNAFLSRLENQSQVRIQKKLQDTMQDKQRLVDWFN